MGCFASTKVGRGLAGALKNRVLIGSPAEKSGFAGNCIALSERDVWMSRAAVAALAPENRLLLEAAGFRVQGVALAEIEKAEGRKREIEAIYADAGFFQKASRAEIDALVAEAQALAPHIEALIHEWESIEEELSGLGPEPPPR